MRLHGALAPEQGIQNAGCLLHWRLEDAAGRVHAAAYEKLLLRPPGGVGRTMRRDWRTEVRALAGLSLCRDDTDCILPRCLGMRRHGQAWGVVTEDLTLSGWRALSLEESAAHASRIAVALAAFAVDYNARSPFSVRHLALPVCRPFFAWPTPKRFTRVERTLELIGLTPGRVRATMTRLTDLERRWDALVVGSGLPWRPCHGDPFHRNILMRGEAVALIDLENAVIGPVGLDIGRFIGSTIMRGAEARALAIHEGRPPPILPPWRDAAALSRFAARLENRHLAALKSFGLSVDPTALRQVSRATALLGMCWASSVLERTAQWSPETVVPLATTIANWSRRV